jgi:hypothetical protein
MFSRLFYSFESGNGGDKRSSTWPRGSIAKNAVIRQPSKEKTPKTTKT